jgi:NMD protein affecting ribosome stability and mRNA decay
LIKIKRTTCPNCAKIHGKRFEAVIQLRNSNLKKIDLNKIVEDIKKFVNEVHLNNYESFIIEIEKSINGYDIKLSNKSLIKKIKSFIETRHYTINKISKKLVGKNPSTGGDLYRIYLLIRIIPLEKGDLIDISKKLYIIKRISNKDVYLEDIDSKKMILRKMKFFEKKNIIVINSNNNRSINEIA